MQVSNNPGQMQKKFWKVAKVLYVLMRILDFVMRLTSDYLKKNRCRIITNFVLEPLKSVGYMFQPKNAA